MAPETIEVSDELKHIALAMALASKNGYCYVYQAVPTLDGKDWWLQDIGRVEAQ